MPPIWTKQAEVPGFEPRSKGSKPLMLSTTPYLQAALSKTAAAHCMTTNAATLLKPRSVALTAKTEGPLQQRLFIEFWSPHISHLFRYIIHSSITPNKLPLRCSFSGNNSVCAGIGLLSTARIRVTYYKGKINNLQF